MSPCGVGREALFALADGEAGGAAWRLAEHRRGCPLCQSRLEELAELQVTLAAHLHACARHLDTLAALRHIRLRHALARRRPLARLREAWVWRWTFARRWVWLAAGLTPTAAALVARALGGGG